MALTNEQHDRIEYIYRIRRQRALEDARARKAAIQAEIPALKTLEEERHRLLLARYQQGAEAHRETGETSAESGAGAAALSDEIARLDETKKQLLTQAGYAADVFEPVYNCPVCCDTGFAGREECSCRRQLITEEFFLSSPLWQRVRTDTFDRFSLDWYDGEKKRPELGGQTERDIMAENLRRAKQYVENFGTQKGNLLLIGPVGTGKTFLCNAVAGALLAGRYSVILLTAPEFFKEQARQAFEDEARNDKLLEEIVKADLLIIDDLGTEFAVRKMAQNALLTVMNTRNLAGLGTILSTNDSPNELKDEYGERIWSRLSDSYRMLRFVGTDIRTQKRKAALRQ